MFRTKVRETKRGKEVKLSERQENREVELNLVS